MPLDQWNNWLPWIHFLRSVLDFYSRTTHMMKRVSLVEQGEVVKVPCCTNLPLFFHVKITFPKSVRLHRILLQLGQSWLPRSPMDAFLLGKKIIEPCWTILGGLTLQSSFLFTSVKGPSHLNKSSIHRLPMFSCWSFGHLLRCLCTCVPWPNQLKNLGQIMLDLHFMITLLPSMKELMPCFF